MEDIKIMASKIIEEYGKYVNSLDASPDELLNMMKIRQRLENVLQELANDYRHKLISYDLQLIKNAQSMSERICLVYDFSLSNEPLSNWWWYLDKVANGKIDFSLNPVIETNKDFERNQEESSIDFYSEVDHEQK